MEAIKETKGKLVKKKTTTSVLSRQSSDIFTNPNPCPDFKDLLSKPLVKQELPSDFNANEEADHLTQLWNETPSLSKFTFEVFVHSGGSGMVFRVKDNDSGNIRALKIARKKLFNQSELPHGAAGSLSPVSDKELKALQNLSHPNVVRLFDVIQNKIGVIAISTTYIEDPKPLNLYILDILAKEKRGVPPFAPSRLDDACKFLVQKFNEIVSALQHMHSLGYYHMDIKPANILLSKDHIAVLTDLGSCIHKKDLEQNRKLRVHFTWTYAHPSLTTIINKPGGISGGGLKASAEIEEPTNLEKFDLFAFGRTMQEVLAILEEEFGERCHANYSFRFLHFLACLCLDGKNALDEGAKKVITRHGIKFISDIALNYPVKIFEVYKTTTAEILSERLKRHSRQYSWNQEIPELDPWQQETLNTGIGKPAPYTNRISKITGHPAFKRLKLEPQLGWIREVYPGATHNRWSHSIGVFSTLVAYYNALLADPDVPSLRIIVTSNDICHAMVAALIHDLGQFSFGHDLEEACPDLFKHEEIIVRLLDEKIWEQKTLRDVIVLHWPKIDIKRIQAILTNSSDSDFPIDGVASDIINGPIDADKYDYLIRDSLACGVAYGKGIDTERLLLALSVSAKEHNSVPRFALSYKAKGASAIESLLLARYQMYGAVYWHHTFRCIQAMYSHAAASTFAALGQGNRKLRETMVSQRQIRELVYHWVVCRKSASALIKDTGGINVPKQFHNEVTALIEGERAIELVWKFADNKIRLLLERLCQRDLYKRVFEISIGELGDNTLYFKLASELAPIHRPVMASKIETYFLNAINKAMQQKGNTETQSENKARERLQELTDNKVPRVVIDYPTRGMPEETNFPSEISDSARKYLSGPIIGKSSKQVFKVVRDLQIQSATLRIYAAPELHEMIIRYLDPNVVENCVSEVITTLKGRSK